MVIGTIPFYGIYAYILFDSDATHLFISTAFIKEHGMLSKSMATKLYDETPVGGTQSTNAIYKSCRVKIGDKELLVELIVLDMQDFDVILGMDWLVACYASVDYHGNRVNFQIPSELEFSFIGSIGVTPPHIILALQVGQMLRKRCRGSLVSIKDTEQDELRCEDIFIANDFSDLFLDDLPRLPSDRKVHFTIDLIPTSGPISKASFEWPLPS